jgi:glycosyltransferase involved in cell wall biosynthesis
VRIFGWAADNAGPGFYRLRVPFGELQQHGYETAIDTTMPEWALEEADTIVGQRVCQPGATARWRRLAAGHYGRRPQLVFELDDDLWHIDPSNTPAWAFYHSNSELLGNLTECARLADMCTVTTEPLADVVRKINPNVVILPNQLPAAAYGQPEPVAGPLRIGWAGGASHALDVEEVTPALRQHFRRHPGDTFRNMGTLFGKVATAVPGWCRHDLPWTLDMNEHYARLSSLDVGLAPLRASVFNQSKSELKFLEYAARGAVTIASNFGPYARTVQPGVTGLLADQPHEWTAALRQLRDPDLRGILAAQGMAYAHTRSIENHWRGWEAVYTT